MHIIVCVKQVIDPETPQSNFKIDPEANRVVPPQGIPPVINAFDEQAVEAALRIKDKDPSTTISVITLGKTLSADIVKKPLSMGADNLYLLQDDALEGGDSHAIATALAAAVKKIGQFDLLLCGRQASDWDNAQVPLGIAELLGIPAVTIAKSVQPTDGKVKVERVVPDGIEVTESPLPALVTVSNELGEPRYPTLKGIMAAGKKKPTVWTAADLGLDASRAGARASKVKLLKLFVPTKEAKCEMISADTPAEAAVQLAVKLRQDKVI